MFGHYQNSSEDATFVDCLQLLDFLTRLGLEAVCKLELVAPLSKILCILCTSYSDLKTSNISSYFSAINCKSHFQRIYYIYMWIVS